MDDPNTFKEKNIYELERELKENARSYNKNKVIACFAIFLFLFIICPDMFLFWVRFGTPHFYKYQTEEVIDISKEPVQIDLAKNKDNYFKYDTLENRGTYTIEKMAKYSISGKLVAKNYLFLTNYLPLIKRWEFHSVSLIDIGLVWQEMSNDDFMRCTKYTSVNVFDGRRVLIPIFTNSRKCNALIHQYANQVGSYHKLYSKFSHTHVIPANSTIMHALLFAPKNMPIKMDGYLVDVYNKGRTIAQTSLSRYDTNVNARGGGACEVMYVERVQVGNKVYE